MLFFIFPLDNYIGMRYNHITIYRLPVYRDTMEVRKWLMDSL